MMTRKYIIFFLVLLTSNLLLAHPKDTSKVEYLKVYFNAVSDHSVAWPNNKSNDHWDMLQPLINRIDSAKYSIDLASYDVQQMRVVHALADAARRGVRVRIVTDNDNRTNAPRFRIPVWDTLRKVGIYSIDDAGTIYLPNGEIKKLDHPLTNYGAIMHHKFAVFDVLSESPDDDYVWSGTMNTTYTAEWNTNATVVIKDNGVAASYAEEFQQMWGSKTNVPNANHALFHKNKERVHQNIHYVDTIRVETYFSPMNRTHTKPSISKRITGLIQDYAKSDVHFLAFAISPNIPISQAMINRSGRGEIALSGVIDPNFYVQYRNKNLIWAQPQMHFGNRLILPAKEVRKLHEKTMLIDPLYPYPKKHKAVTIVGSYNFSNAAEKSNDENILLIFNNKITNQFYQDFSGILKRAKGELYHRYPPIDTAKWYAPIHFDKSGSISVELDTNFYYPIQLLGTDIPRNWAGSKDSAYYYSTRAHRYLKSLVRGKNSAVKISGGNDFPAHKFNRYYGYITLKKDGKEIPVNRQMIATGNASFSKWNSQQRDSIIAYKFAEEMAKKKKIGMWAYPDSIGVKKITAKAKMMKNAFPLNVNTATKNELMLIPHIGPATASAIIAYREHQGKIKTLEELDKVRGIGPKTIERLHKYLIISKSSQ